MQYTRFVPDNKLSKGAKSNFETIDLEKKVRVLTDGREITLSYKTKARIEKTKRVKKFSTPAHKCLWDGISLGSTTHVETIKYNGKEYSRQF